jgi:hypothetical protein
VHRTPFQADSGHEPEPVEHCSRRPVIRQWTSVRLGVAAASCPATTVREAPRSAGVVGKARAIPRRSEQGRLLRPIDTKYSPLAGRRPLRPARRLGPPNGMIMVSPSSDAETPGRQLAVVAKMSR